MSDHSHSNGHARMSNTFVRWFTAYLKWKFVYLFSTGIKECIQCIRNSRGSTSPEPRVWLHDIRRDHQSLQSCWNWIELFSIPENEFWDHHSFSAWSCTFGRHRETRFSFITPGCWSSGWKRHGVLWAATAAALMPQGNQTFYELLRDYSNLWIWTMSPNYSEAEMVDPFTSLICTQINLPKCLVHVQFRCFSGKTFV